MSQFGVRSLIAEKEIKYLMHFTRVENLKSILNHGLLPRCDLDQESVQYVATDPARFDRHKDALNLSVSFPNSSMFFTKRRNMGGDWVVLMINPEVMVQESCFFYPNNAASRSFNPYEDRSSVKDFKKMFSKTVLNNQGEIVKRKYLGLPNCFPTNLQAEVLVFSRVKVSMLMAVNFFDQKSFSNFLMRSHGAQLPSSVSLKVEPIFFDNRVDWLTWLPSKKLVNY